MVNPFVFFFWVFGRNLATLKMAHLGKDIKSCWSLLEMPSLCHASASNSNSHSVLWPINMISMDFWFSSLANTCTQPLVLMHICSQYCQHLYKETMSFQLVAMVHSVYSFLFLFSICYSGLLSCFMCPGFFLCGLLVT